MSNKDPFGMRRPAQQFKTMVETQRERADKAERQCDQLAEALRHCVATMGMDNPTATAQYMALHHARAALKAMEDE